MSKDPFAHERERELARWPGARVEQVREGRHSVVRLLYAGGTALITCSKSASCPRAVKNHIGDLRRALRGLADATGGKIPSMA